MAQTLPPEELKVRQGQRRSREKWLASLTAEQLELKMNKQKDRRRRRAAARKMSKEKAPSQMKRQGP